MHQHAGRGCAVNAAKRVRGASQCCALQHLTRRFANAALALTKDVRVHTDGCGFVQWPRARLDAQEIRARFAAAARSSSP